MAIHSVDAEAGSVLTQFPCESQLSLQRSPRCRSMSTLALAGGLALAQSVASSNALPPSPEGDEGAEAATSSTQPSSFRKSATCDNTSDGWSLREGAVAQRRERQAKPDPTSTSDSSQDLWPQPMWRLQPSQPQQSSLPGYSCPSQPEIGAKVPITHGSHSHPPVTRMRRRCLPCCRLWWPCHQVCPVHQGNQAQRHHVHCRPDFISWMIRP